MSVMNTIPSKDERSKSFFRVKIGGTSTTSSTVTSTPTKSIDGNTSGQVAPTGLISPTGNSTVAVATTSKSTSLASNSAVATDVDSKASTAQLKSNTTSSELIFDSLLGDILETPYISLTTYQHATAKFIIFDPDDTIRSKINKLDNVEIEIGFLDGYKKNKFIGVIYSVGRKLPNGTMVEAIDTSYQLQQTTSTVKNSSVATGQAPTSTAQSGQYTTKSSFQGEASFYGHGDGFDGKKTANGETFKSQALTAAHKTLPFGTMVRVTNPKNQKSVVLRINDRGPYSGGRILDMSYAGAVAIGLVDAGVGLVIVEVLESKAASKDSTLAKPIKPKTPSATAPTGTAQQAPTTALSSTDLQTPTTTADLGTTNETFSISNALSKDTGFATTKSLANIFSAEVKNLKFSETGLGIDVQKQGEVIFAQSKIAAAELEAALQGKTIVVRGNTMSVVAPGAASSSGVVIDYQTNRAAFIGHPVITKRSNVQLQSGYGAITVQGWDTNNKTSIGATVVAPGSPVQHPTGIIHPPEWGAIKLSSPIIPGSPYTWADATKNGTRVPANKEIMGAIIQICQLIIPLTKQTNQQKWEITSWYRPPEVNRLVGGKVASRHLSGDAVDAYFPGYQDLHKALSASWPGGIAIGLPPKYNPGFIHIDARHLYGQGQARWNY